MAIGTPQLLGDNDGQTSSGSTTIVVTTVANHAAGHTILAAVFLDGNRSVVSVTDSASNTYTACGAAASTGTGATNSKIHFFRSPGTNALNSGGTVTVTTSGLSAGGTGMIVCDVSGTVGTSVDAFGSNTGTSGDPTVNITTVAADTITFAGSTQQNNLPGVGYTQDADYTDILIERDIAGENVTYGLAYRIRSSAGADTWAPTTGLSVHWAAAAASFAASTGDGFTFLPILGVGT